MSKAFGCLAVLLIATAPLSAQSTTSKQTLPDNKGPVKIRSLVDQLDQGSVVPPDRTSTGAMRGEIQSGEGGPPPMPPVKATTTRRGALNGQSKGFWAPDYSVPPASVAIFQDMAPWGSTAITDLLNLHGIPWALFDSTAMGVIDLRPFDKIVIASMQPLTFYQAISANRMWFEDWVCGGGTLEFHGAGWTPNDWYGLSMPGGLTCAKQDYPAEDDNLTLQDPGSVLANTPNILDSNLIDNWSYSTHSFFTGAEANYDTIITEDEFGMPTLIDFRLGSGRIIATLMTVEWAGADLRVLENMLLASGAGKMRHVAVLKDVDPWGQTLIQDTYTLYGIPYTVIGSAGFGMTPLHSYDKVVVASSQPLAFYQALSNARNWLDSYVMAGGTLEFHGATYFSDDWSALPMPAGLAIAVQDTTNADDALTIVDPTSPLTTWVHPLDSGMIDGWLYSTHSFFIGAAAPYNVVIVEDEFGMPVLIDFPYGAGRVYATMMTVEWGGGDPRVAENLLLNGGGGWVDKPTNVALFKDNDPWGAPANEAMLKLHAVPYTVFNSSAFGVVDLSTYDKIIIPSDQTTAFYTTLSANAAWIDKYIQMGVTFEFHGALGWMGGDWYGLPAPAGLKIAPQLGGNEDDNLTIADRNALLTKVPNLWDDGMLDGWSASTHGFFTGAATSFDTVVTEDEFNQPTLIDFSWYHGRVLATMMTVDWGGADPRALENLILTCNGSPAAWRNYGKGWPGTLGVPSLTADSDPVLGSNISILVGNSAGIPTTGFMLLGFWPASVPTTRDGTILVSPFDFMIFPMKASGLVMTGELPFDPSLAGVSVYLQVLEHDLGASKKMSFTPGLELSLGL